MNATRTLVSILTVLLLSGHVVADDRPRRLLYVAEPGIRNYVEFGGHGILVFDIDRGHAFVKRIPLAGLGDDRRPLNVKGVCANATTHRIYVSTLRHLMCVDLITDELLWEKTYEKGCDRMSMTPDGKIIYLPTLEREHWKVIDAATGDEIVRITPDSGSHNTVIGLDGRFAYLAGLRSPVLTVADTKTHKVTSTIGPFSASIRPFTVNGAQTLCFVNVNNLLGFEIGDLKSGMLLHRVEVTGFERGPVKRHGCPSHGIGLTPDESEIWVTDGHNSHMHVFDATVMPPKLVASLPVRDQPGWITFTLVGDYAYPSTGDVFDTRTRGLVTQLADEEGRIVQSEKMIEIDFVGDKPVQVGDQFGLGRVQ